MTYPSEPIPSPTAARRYIHHEEELDLSCIGEDEATQIATELTTNTTLFKLSLDRIGDGGALALMPALSANKTLTKLSLSYNGIGDAGMEALGQALMQNESLEWLDVGSNKFGTVGLASFANALKANKGLTKLLLWYNSIDDEGSRIVATALKWNTTLTELVLSSNKIGDEGAATLGEALKTNSTLKSLSLSYSVFGEEGATSLLHALTEWNTTLTFLGFENDSTRWHHGHTSWAIVRAIHALLDANEAGTRLLHAASKLDLSSKNIYDKLARQIAKELACNETITSLDLSKSVYGGSGGIIVNALVKNRTLMSIRLDDNHIECSDCSAIAAAIRVNTALRKLFLNGNRIGLAGATALADALRVNESLQVLGLGRNLIRDNGAAAVANAFRSNATVRRLDLNGNSITDAGALAILTTLKEYNHVLTTVNLRDNADISPVLQEKIDFLLFSRLVLVSFLTRVYTPLEKRLTQLAIRALQASSLRRMESEPLQWHGTAAGPIFYLVKSLVKEGDSPSRKRLR
jgi:NLR family CARD domain-containing protein 3